MGTCLAYRVTAPIAALGVDERRVALGFELLVWPQRNRVRLVWNGARALERSLRWIDVVPYIADGRLAFVEEMQSWPPQPRRTE